jgi:hypothetical protein
MAKYLSIYDNPIVELLPKSTRGRFKVKVAIKHTLSNGVEIIVPINYISNGASIPKLLRGIYSQQGVYIMPSIIHDYLYDNKLYSRKFADRQFLLDMGKTNTSQFTKWLFYYIIRIFGKSNYNNNESNKTTNN